ncbi:sensor histidine kinase [Paracoccus sp. (in: a-proteobacteria)]|uniref:sensor histidine kinase n=1 Tax=Paracoccus sp. TaxID=267 RepID=UPI00289F32B7|nr:sensor histidine kinase [Paracoccus sp. (in: a-proteobacteria)]
MTQRPFSLRNRLLAWLLMATAVLGSLALIDTWREAVRMANLLSDRVLAGSALIIAERAALDQGGALIIDIPYGALQMLSSAAQDRVFYRVDGPPGVIVTGYDDLPVAPARPDGPPVFADAIYKGQPVRVASLARAASTGIDEIPFVVTLAETTQARQELTLTILIRSALRLLGMIAGAALIVWVAVTISLRPLYRLGDEIAARSFSDLHPIETPVPTEVRGLVETVNSFMRRLQSAVEGLRNFSGNAGHQLRTPLTVVRMQLALARRATRLAQAQEAAAKSDEAVARAEQVLGQLLLLARVDAAGGDGPRIARMDLTAFARELTAQMVPAALDAGIDLGFEGGQAQVITAEPLLLGEALRNLIDNAVRYAGRGAIVTVRSTKDGAGIPVLEVEDNGPGIPRPARGAAISRFGRGETDLPGSGLGLAVVQEIATLFGAELRLGSGPGGRGLRVQLSFAPKGMAAGAQIQPPPQK